MALRNTITASASIMVGLTLMVSAFREHGPDPQPRATPVAPAGSSAPGPDRPPAPATPSPTVASAVPGGPGIDRSLPTGSLPRDSGLVKPNPAAYADAAKPGSSLILTGAEAINYLAGNTLRREGAGEPLHFTYFASRGVSGDGDPRGFVARAWNRNRPDLCETASDGKTTCRPIRILLDAKSELVGSRLGTVVIGDGATAVLIKGNVLKFPDHIPYLDSVVGSEIPHPDVSARKGTAAWQDVVGRPVTVKTATGGDRRTVLYGRDNRVLDLQPAEDAAGGKAVKVTVGHWRLSKTGLCQTRLLGDASQVCFKLDAAAEGVVKLDPAAKSGEAETLGILSETGARAVAQD